LYVLVGLRRSNFGEGVLTTPTLEMAFPNGDLCGFEPEAVTTQNIERGLCGYGTSDLTM
jgi:hypothetical protein